MNAADHWELLLFHTWVNKYSKIVYVDGGNGDVMSWRHRSNVKLIQAVQELSVMWSYLVCTNTVEFYWWSLYLSSISGKFMCLQICWLFLYQWWEGSSLQHMTVKHQKFTVSETETLVCHVCCRARSVCQRRTRWRMGAQISRLPQREQWTLWTDYLSLYMLHNPYRVSIHTHTHTHTSSFWGAAFFQQL